jgi:hypothetical protein
MTGTRISPSTLQIEVQADTMYAGNDFSVITYPSVLKGTISLANADTTPLQAIEVALKADNGEVVQKAHTNTSGEYAFMQVDSGTYTIEYVLPTYYEAQSAMAGTLGGTPSSGQQEVQEIPVRFDQQGLDYNFFLQAKSGRIGGMVYQVNEEGAFLRPASGVVVYLHDTAQMSPFAIDTPSLLSS